MGKEEIDNMGDIRQTIKAKKWNMILGFGYMYDDDSFIPCVTDKI